MGVQFIDIKPIDPGLANTISLPTSLKNLFSILTILHIWLYFE